MAPTDGTRRESITVLHVDDDPQLPEVVATHLAQLDQRLSVITEGSAEAGLERLQDTGIDCIISDYQMPGTDGLEFLQAVRATHPSLPFILFTGKGSEDVAAKAINEGVDAYVQKKLGSGQYSVLANHITTLVEKHRTEKRLAWIERNTHLPDRMDAEQTDDPTDPLESSVSMQVVRKVADAEDVDPVELPPLYEVIDPDLVDELFGSAAESHLSVTFEYNGQTVTIEADRDVTLGDRLPS